MKTTLNKFHLRVQPVQSDSNKLSKKKNKIRFVFDTVCVFPRKLKYQLCQKCSFLLNHFFYSYSILVVSSFPLVPSSSHPTPWSHSQFPHCCPCLWVIQKCPLSSPFPFFPPLFPSPLPSGTFSLLHGPMPVALFCSLVYFVH